VTDTDSISVVRQLYSGLLRLDEDQNLTSDLAEVPTLDNGGISADGLTYTFSLNDGLVWSDGEPLVAQAFVDAAKRIFAPGSANFYADFYRVIAADGAQAALSQGLADGVEGDALTALEQAVVDGLEVTAPDDQTVVFQLNSPSPIFPLLATLWTIFPVRQDIIDSAGDAWTEAGTLVGNGAFVLSEWNHDEGVVLTRSDNWHRGPALLDSIEYDINADSAIAFLAYQEGELDVVKLGPAELVQVRGTDLEEQFQAYAQLVTIGIYFNFDYAPLQDVRVRKALASAIDRLEYAEIVREGSQLPAFTWVPPGMPGYDPTLGLQYDNAIDTAKALLTDAGYPDGAGLEIDILSADSTTGVLTVEWLKEQWEKNLGITVTVTTVDRASYFELRNASDYQVTTGGWGADYPDPQNWLPLFQTGGALNSGNFSNADFDALIVSAETEFDNDARIQMYLDAQTIMIDQLPFAPMYHARRNILMQPWVQGMVLSSMENNVPGDLFLDKVFIEGRP
jgi:oligopeptide transport system substrate-binding protein